MLLLVNGETLEKIIPSEREGVVRHFHTLLVGKPESHTDISLNIYLPIYLPICWKGCHQLPSEDVPQAVASSCFPSPPHTHSLGLSEDTPPAGSPLGPARAGGGLVPLRL